MHACSFSCILLTQFHIILDGNIVTRKLTFEIFHVIVNSVYYAQVHTHIEIHTCTHAYMAMIMTPQFTLYKYRNLLKDCGFLKML